MTTQWGAPLTGAQMRLLRAAGLPDRTNTNHHGWEFLVEELTLGDKEYRLPDDHAAYTLAKAGWLDGRNVALWFGGDKAPDDWDGKHVLLRKGLETWGADDSSWVYAGDETDIVAYIAKAEARTSPDTHSDRTIGRGLPSFEQPKADTVTIEKMTEAEAEALWMFSDGTKRTFVDRLRQLGLIREPTRLERFWAARDTKDVYGPPCKAFQLIEEALEFERD